MIRKLLLVFKSSHEFLLPAFLISLFGLMVLLSQSPEDFQRQAAFIVVGLIFFVGFSLASFETMSRLSLAVLFSLYALLLTNLLVGQSTRGAVRWISFGTFAFQPSEVVKPFLGLALSFVLGDGFSVKKFVAAVCIAAPAVVLTFMQPDLGTALVLLVIFASSVALCGMRPFFYFVFGSLGAALSGLTYFFGLKDYQRERLHTFVNPLSDPLGSGYNVLQSKISFGSGRFFGRGFGHGSQSRLNFLPESKTDFIFASLGEEWGFVGSSIVLGIFCLCSFGILRLAGKVTKGARLFCFSAWACLVFQVFVNIGMNLGIMPVTGIPLPFVSLGGSSLVAFFIMFGILASIANEDKLL